MLGAARSTLLILTTLLVATLAMPLGMAGPGDGDGCVNLNVADWGGPVMVYPYMGDAVGVALTEDIGDGATLGIIVMPSLCHVSVFSPLGLDQLMGGTRPSEPGLPVLP